MQIGPQIWNADNSPNGAMRCKVYVFVMFKITYLINKMQYNILSQQVWWLDGKGVCL